MNSKVPPSAPPAKGSFKGFENLRQVLTLYSKNGSYPFYTTPIINQAQISLDQALFGPCFGLGGGMEGGILEAYDWRAWVRALTQERLRVPKGYERFYKFGGWAGPISGVLWCPFLKDWFHIRCH